MTSKINHNYIVMSILKINKKIRREFWIFQIWMWAWTWISEKLFVRIKRRLFRQLEKVENEKPRILIFEKNMKIVAWYWVSDWNLAALFEAMILPIKIARNLHYADVIMTSFLSLLTSVFRKGTVFHYRQCFRAHKSIRSSASVLLLMQSWRHPNVRVVS